MKSLYWMPIFIRAVTSPVEEDVLPPPTSLQKRN